MTDNEIRDQVSQDLKNYLDYPKSIFGEVPEGNDLLEIEVSVIYFLLITICYKATNSTPPSPPSWIEAPPSRPKTIG